MSKLQCSKRFTILSEQLLNDLTDTLEESEHSMFEEINFASGVLTIEMTDGRAYVLNKQAPNMQVWLSSPISGPQRFEYNEGIWLQIKTGEEIVE